MKAVFSHTIKQFSSIRTGDYILPDEGLVSFLRRINSQNSLEILIPSQNGTTIFWKSKDCEYLDFNTLSDEQKEKVIQTFNGFRIEVLEQAEKVLQQEFTSLKLEQNAKSFSELLKKTVDFQNIKLFYSEEKNRIGLIFGFVFSDQEVVDFGNQYLVSEQPEVNNGQEVINVTEPIIETNPTVHSIEDNSPITALPVTVRRQRHPWWINTIRGINWFAWRYWWLVWLIFLLSLLLLYLFCPCKKTSQNQSCDQLHHIHKNIDTLNSGLLFCCDCKISYPPDTIKKDSTAVDCPDRILAFQVCNSNSSRDDDFDVLLNGVKIGELNLNTDAKVGSVFLATTNRSISIERADFTCPISSMKIYYFDPSIIRYGTNILFLKNIKNNGNSNAGSIEIRNYLLKDNKLVDPCRVKDLPFRFNSGLDFKTVFEYTKCCENTP